MEFVVVLPVLEFLSDSFAYNNTAILRVHGDRPGVAARVVGVAFAEDDFAIEGVYTQNELCRGDGTQQKFLRVTVTAQDVSYSGGVCSIDSRQQDGDRLAMRVTCKFTSGAVMASAVTFTKKDNNTFDMAQNEGTYKAVLHRCPG